MQFPPYDQGKSSESGYGEQRPPGWGPTGYDQPGWQPSIQETWRQIGGDHGASDQQRPRTLMLGNSLAIGVAVIPAVLVGLGYLLINGIVAVIAFLATWLIAAFLVRCGFALINMERLLHDRL